MKNYQINLATKTLTLSKAFLRKASVVGSNEYIDLVALRKDFDGYTITVKTIKKKTDKKKHEGLNYKRMGKYIELTNGVDSPAMRAFEHIKALATTQSGQYAYVKKWFLKSFPDYDKTQVWTQEIGIQAVADESNTKETQDAAA